MSESMTMERRKIGPLDCVVVDAPGCDKEVRCVVILCHGFGASGEDLVPCAPELHGMVEGGLNHVRFVFPAAPIELDPGGFYDSRAWWPIDMIRLQQIMETGELRDLRNERPELLDLRRQQVIDLIHAIAEETSLTLDRFVLGGFSQGAMLTTEVALSLDECVGGLVIWSGTLLSEQQWLEYLKTRRGLRIVQSHGTIDPILPFQGAVLLRELLTRHEMPPEFIEFTGQHTIPREAIARAANLISQVARQD